MLSNKIYSKKIDGHGPYNFILIHNAGGSHKMFSHQIEMLIKHGSVVLLDLPGHGLSEACDNNGIRESSELIKKLCVHYSLDEIWLVGLNNGANIAIDIAHQRCMELSGMILIDPALFLDDNFINEIHLFIDKLKKSSYDEFIHILVTDLLVNSDQVNRDIASEAFMKVDKTCLKNMFLSLIEWDKSSKSILPSIDIPTLHILTDEHHCTFEMIKKIAPQFSLGKVIGSKCWATLEVPEQVNAMIERFLVMNKAPLR